MASIQCPGCSAHLSLGAGRAACPRCAAPLPARAAPPTTRQRPRAPWLAGALLATVALLAGALGYRALVPSGEQLRRTQVSRALAACQQALATSAQYGPSMAPPFTRDQGSGNDFYFAWPRGSFTFANGYGAQVPMSASCLGQLDTGAITQLTLNGRDLR